MELTLILIVIWLGNKYVKYVRKYQQATKHVEWHKENEVVTNNAKYGN